ncbi:MAG: ABC transporter, partial [Silicimonas sp.]|nr:ABC transporter [Silicimonas sp.]
AREGKTVVVSLHDLALASRYCDRLVLLDRGEVVSDGDPRDVLNAARMRAVFAVGGHWSETPQGPVFQPIEMVEK